MSIRQTPSYLLKTSLSLTIKSSQPSSSIYYLFNQSSSHSSHYQPTANMRASFITIITLFSAAFAAPSVLDARSQACSGNTQPQCCSTDIEGLAALACETRMFSFLFHECKVCWPHQAKDSPQTASDLVSACKKVTKQGACCTIAVVSPLSIHKLQIITF